VTSASATCWAGRWRYEAAQLAAGILRVCRLIPHSSTAFASMRRELTVDVARDLRSEGDFERVSLPPTRTATGMTLAHGRPQHAMPMASLIKDIARDDVGVFPVSALHDLLMPAGYRTSTRRWHRTGSTAARRR
jgi:hypothetical protein